MTNEQSEQIRQKAREEAEKIVSNAECATQYEFRQDDDYRGTIVLNVEAGLVRFAESLLSGGAAANEENKDDGYDERRANAILRASMSLSDEAAMKSEEWSAAPAMALGGQSETFAKEIRAACFRDVTRLIAHSIDDCPTPEGKEALRIVGAAMVNQGVEGFGEIIPAASGSGTPALCPQCAANARWNEAGGYHELAQECRDYCARGHKESGSGTPATPSTPKLRPQVPEWDYESQHEREKAIMALQEERGHKAIAAAVAAEREECAKLAESIPRSNEGPTSFAISTYRIAKAIRGRAPQPAPHIHTASCYKCGHDDCPCHGGCLHELPMCNPEPQGGKEAQTATPESIAKRQSDVSAMGASIPGASGLLAYPPSMCDCKRISVVHNFDDDCQKFATESYQSGLLALHSPFPWHVEPTRNDQAWLLVDANGEKVALANCTDNAKQNMECIAAMTRAHTLFLPAEGPAAKEGK